MNFTKLSMEQSKGKSLCSKTCAMWILILILMPNCVLASVPAKTTKCYECGGPFPAKCEEGEGAEIQTTKETCLAKFLQVAEYFKNKYGRKFASDAQEKSRQLEDLEVYCITGNEEGEKWKTCAVNVRVPATPHCDADQGGPGCICVGDLCNKNGFEDTPPQPIDFSSPSASPTTSTSSKTSGGGLAVVLTVLRMALAWW